MALQNSEILLHACLKVTVKNYKKKIKKNIIFMVCYWIEYISQHNFSDLIIIITIIIIIIIIIFLLFTLSSIYIIPETNNSNWT